MRNEWSTIILTGMNIVIITSTKFLIISLCFLSGLNDTPPKTRSKTKGRLSGLRAYLLEVCLPT